MNEFSSVPWILVTGGGLNGVDGIATAIYGVAWWDARRWHHLRTDAIKQLLWNCARKMKRKMKQFVAQSFRRDFPSEFTQLSDVFVPNLPATLHATCCPSASRWACLGRFPCPAARRCRRGCRGSSAPLQFQHLRRPTRSSTRRLFRWRLIENWKRELEAGDEK